MILKNFEIMRSVNPLVIPRNHLVEEALDLATQQDNLNKVNELLKVLKNPYNRNSKTSDYQSMPLTNEKY